MRIALVFRTRDGEEPQKGGLTKSMIRGAVLALAFLAGCGGSDPVPTVTSTRLNDKGPIFRSLAVTLSQPGGVEVEYWTGSTPHLSVKSASSSATTHEVALPRLRANSPYSYHIRSSSGSFRSDPSTAGSFQTGELPADLKSIVFTATGTSSAPLIFLSVRSDFNGGVIVDSEGNVVWYGRTSVSPQGAVRRPNFNWVLVEDGLAEFSPLGEKVRVLAQSRMPAGAAIHHGVANTPQDTLVFLALDPKTFGPTVINGEAIWEWNPQDDALAKRWSAFEHLDPTVDFSSRSIPTDWFHANSLAYGTHGNVIVSFHFLDQVLSLAPDLSSIEWRLGGPGSTFAVTADQATSGQHSAREIAPNEILLFDNGFARANGDKFSRALQLRIDTVTKTVETDWQYRPSPDIWATVISSVRRLANGNSVVTFGTPAGLLGATGPISAHEVAPDGTLLWKLNIELPNGSVFQGDPIQSIAGETTLQ